MPCYHVKWPDGTIEIVFAEDDTELFGLLDEEGSPYSAEIHEINPTMGRFAVVGDVIAGDVEVLKETKVIRCLTSENLDRSFQALYGKVTG